MKQEQLFSSISNNKIEAISEVKEIHLFSGIGGGIYGGKLLRHTCIAGIEIDEFCQKVLEQRQKDKWLEKFPIYGDLKQLRGYEFEGKFDVLCGGFPCQAFSTAAHGKNIAEKNLWGEMYRFIQESDAPIVFGENVTLKALEKAKYDLEIIGYTVQLCKLSCSELNADHRRDRFWLLAVKDWKIFQQVAQNAISLPKFKANTWKHKPYINDKSLEINKRKQLKAIGNAQSPFAAAVAFRVLVNRHLLKLEVSAKVQIHEIENVFHIQDTWIKENFGKNFGFVHTPTTMANYSAPSMMKHQGCRNFVQVFDRPNPANAEYLMGFPMGASAPISLNKDSLKNWLDDSYL